ncbi:hypothetical protein NC652_014360 [Populus alba x Populus x berolinensis]|nr:hypothetical protein NC652_013578 [Populus alba x Populus x berolinensis]KAJ6929745.1 hypothetical protein NC652_013582 [Populus alba x Populus x berolinensis]KAJ6930813.1 hypothetical protein NC652_014360 [Populus alba x Populus x berolinensis]
MSLQVDLQKHHSTRTIDGKDSTCLFINDMKLNHIPRRVAGNSGGN